MRLAKRELEGEVVREPYHIAAAELGDLIGCQKRRYAVLFSHQFEILNLRCKERKLQAIEAEMVEVVLEKRVEIAMKRAQFRELLLKKDLALKGVVSEDDGFPMSLGVDLKPTMPQEKEGWLELKGDGVFDSWKRRYVVLMGSRLLTMKREEDQAHGRCKLMQLSPEAMNANGLLQIQGRYSFGLTVRTGKYSVKQYLVGDTDHANAMRWYMTLLGSCGVEKHRKEEIAEAIRRDAAVKKEARRKKAAAEKQKKYEKWMASGGKADAAANAEEEAEIAAMAAAFAVAYTEDLPDT